MNNSIVCDHVDVVWIDGYLKGVNSVANSRGAFTANALLLSLAGDSPDKSYLEFMNKNDDFDELKISFPPLVLSGCKTIDHWEDNVRKLIYNSFSAISPESLEDVIYQALDMLSVFVYEAGLKKVFSYSGKRGEALGEYIFFQLSDGYYLILSFIRH